MIILIINKTIDSTKSKTKNKEQITDVKASLKEVIDYIYRNRKYINAWIKYIALKSDKSDHFALESEMKVIEY